MTNPSPPQGKFNKPEKHPYRSAGAVVMVIAALISWAVYKQYLGDFTPKAQLTLLSPRAGLVMDPGSKVSYNGVQVGKVDDIQEIDEDGEPAAKFTLNVYPRYLKLIPSNVDARLAATTLFGGKYVALTAPENPTPERISPKHVIDARAVSTEINTLLQTVMALNDHVDPVKLNLTLSAAAEALDGLGDKFGQSTINANEILDEVNPLQPQVRRDIQQLAALADIYSDAAPDLLEGLDNIVVTVRTLNAQQKDLDAALLAAAGMGNNGADVLGRGGPYLERAIDDLVPTTDLLDAYSPAVHCALRRGAEVLPQLSHILGGKDGYALDTNTQFIGGLGLLLNPTALFGFGIPSLGISGLVSLIGGSPNPYIYPDNLPRTNAHGGPGGAPGCWQKITRDFWPGPTLVADTGASLAPYNHLDVGSPYAIEYVYGRQVGDYTINP